MSDSIERVIAEMLAVRAPDFGSPPAREAIYCWATRLRSLRQVPERWSARYFASGPQGEFFTPSREFAEALIAGMKYDRDDWTITDLSIDPTDEWLPRLHRSRQ